MFWLENTGNTLIQRPSSWYVEGEATVTNKHLITGPKGNSEFCLPEILMFNEENPRFEGARTDHV